MVRKISVVTGSRADYGLLKKLMKLIQSDSNMTLEIIATGSHYSSDHGNTYREIESDGFRIDHKVEILENFVDEIGVSTAMGKAKLQITKILKDSRPDILLVLGDRYEILSAVICALLLKIPVAHIHGGEITQGAFDDSIRHAITKMSHVHFVSTEKSKQRVIQMGESMENIYLVGGLGVDAIEDLILVDKSEIEQSMKFTFAKKNLIVTFHPETNSELAPREQIKALLDALSEFEDINFIFTGVNADPGSSQVTAEIMKFVETRTNAVLIHSLGQKNYFSSVFYSDGVIGNSSSGVLEVPSLRKPTVNIGNRQLGREFAESVVNCELRSEKIADAIRYIYSNEISKKLEHNENPYGKGGASLKIYHQLKGLNLAFLTNKKFIDL
jgi:GDP/UDP-N,N'-diacetylbacillosamine 2-epimerase (hydrolysing)